MYSGTILHLPFLDSPTSGKIPYAEVICGVWWQGKARCRVWFVSNMEGNAYTRYERVALFQITDAQAKVVPVFVCLVYPRSRVYFSTLPALLCGFSFAEIYDDLRILFVLAVWPNLKSFWSC